MLRRAFESFQRGDVDAIREAMADDIVTHRPEPDNATFEGKEGFFAALADWTEGFSDWRVTPREFIEAGEDSVVVRVLQSAVVGGGSVPVESEFWFTYSFRDDGKIVRTSYHTREDEAFAAVGGT